MHPVSRRIDFEEDALVLRYDGLDAGAALLRRLRVPYAAIAHVTVGLSDPPGALAWRVGLSTAPFGERRRGRFREQGTWSFFDVSDPGRTVVLDLDGHALRRVALTVDDPEGTAARLRERLSESA
jgi:hypothetical protein